VTQVACGPSGYFLGVAGFQTLTRGLRRVAQKLRNGFPGNDRARPTGADARFVLKETQVMRGAK
jgi:hypothetical protein